ncbi:MAG TPA: hypothetical protein VIL78_07195 [Hanamia sp.]
MDTNLINNYEQRLKNPDKINGFDPKDFTGENEPDTLEQNNAINKLVYIPDWNNKPETKPAILSLKGEPILSHQNTTAIIAAPGFGKSSICEAASASYLNHNADCLGLEVHKDCNGIIHIDFERTNIDVWNSRSRMCDRAGIRYGQDTPRVVFAGMRSIPRLKERLEEIEHLLLNNPCGLLVLDGAGDMVTDTNDLPQAIECRIFLRELTVKYNLSILTTLHPNPNSFKPRGHIGSEIMREAESVLVVKKIESDCKILTTDFEFGKNRNGAHANSAYKWSTENHMFLSIDIDELKHDKQEAKDSQKMEWTKDLAGKVLPTPNSLKNSELLSNIMIQISKTESTAKRVLKDMVGWGFVEKRSDGFYRLIV